MSESVCRCGHPLRGRAVGHMYRKDGKWVADLLDEVVDWHAFRSSGLFEIDDVEQVHGERLVRETMGWKCIDGCHCEKFEPIDYAHLPVVAISSEAEAAMRREEDAARTRAQNRAVRERQAREFVR